MGNNGLSYNVYVHYKSIAIRVDCFLSKPHSINSGVPQESVISPVIFILFINDLLSSISSSDCRRWNSPTKCPFYLDSHKYLILVMYIVLLL